MSQDRDQNEEFRLAAFNGDLRKLQDLWNKCTKADRTDLIKDREYTAFRRALNRGHVETAKWLIEKSEEVGEDQQMLLQRDGNRNYEAFNLTLFCKNIDFLEFIWEKCSTAMMRAKANNAQTSQLKPVVIIRAAEPVDMIRAHEYQALTGALLNADIGSLYFMFARMEVEEINAALKNKLSRREFSNDHKRRIERLEAMHREPTHEGYIDSIDHVKEERDSCLLLERYQLDPTLTKAIAVAVEEARKHTPSAIYFMDAFQELKPLIITEQQNRNPQLGNLLLPVLEDLTFSYIVDTVPQGQIAVVVKSMRQLSLAELSLAEELNIARQPQERWLQYVTRLDNYFNNEAPPPERLADRHTQKALLRRELHFWQNVNHNMHAQQEYRPHIESRGSYGML